MHFQHSAQLWRDFPALVPGVLYIEGIPAAGGARTSPAVDRYAAIAKSRLATVTAESELPEIQAWRRAFAQMGLKPTQYRCASESLLRRFRKEGSLPALHPLVDLCNAISLAFAIPLAVLDASAGVVPDYAVAVDAATLATPARLGGEIRLLVAATVGPVRLIDNVGTVLEDADQAAVTGASAPSTPVAVA